MVVALLGVAGASLVRVAHAESALLLAARGVAHDLGPLPPRALVVVAPHTVAVPRGDELVAAMGGLIAGAMGGDARAAEAPMLLPLARARVSAAKASALVYVDVRVASGELRLTADVYPVVANGWDRLRSAPPPPSAHVFVRSPVGAEVRSYLPAVHLEAARLQKVHHDLGGVLALACGDVDGDGANDLVVVTAQAVLVGHLEAGRFVVVQRSPASRVSHRVPVPFREAIAAVVLAADATPPGLYVAWGDHEGAVLGPDLAPRSAITGWPVWTGRAVACVTPEAARGGFPDTLVGCGDGKPLANITKGTTPAPPLLADAWTALDFEGDAHLVAEHEPSGALHLALGRDALVVNDVGAAFAVVDLDQDGSPEVVTTMARGEDALVVSSLQKGLLVPRRKWAAPAGVDAVAVCPAGESNAPTLVASVGSELWHVE